MQQVGTATKKVACRTRTAKEKVRDRQLSLAENFPGQGGRQRNPSHVTGREALTKSEWDAGLDGIVRSSRYRDSRSHT